MNSLCRQAPAVRLAWAGRRRHWLLTGAALRSVHTRRELPYPIDKGVGEFLPPVAVQTIVDWQDGLLERLNEQVKGTKFERKSIFQTIIDNAHSLQYIHAFNFASLALNNSFFMDQLRPPEPNYPTHEERMVQSLAVAIRRDFGSLEQMKSIFAGTAEGMSSSGWVWLVIDQPSRKLAIVPTFGAGTLLARSRLQVLRGLEPILRDDITRVDPSESKNEQPSHTFQGRRPSPPASFSSPTSGIKATLPTIDPHTPSRTLSTTFSYEDKVSVFDEASETLAQNPTLRQDEYFKIGSHLTPLFCLSVHEHAWMSAGYGVWGKLEYSRRFWTALDWAKVSDTFQTFQPPTTEV